MESFSIDQWCEAHGFSRGFFYQMLKRGEAPKTFKVGRCHRISKAANAEWIAAREAATHGVAA